MFPAEGYETANANSVPTIASNALPPFFNMFIPIWLASFLAETTIAFSETTPSIIILLQEEKNNNVIMIFVIAFNVNILSQFTNSNYFTVVLIKVYLHIDNFNATYKINIGN